MKQKILLQKILYKAWENNLFYKNRYSVDSTIHNDPIEMLKNINILERDDILNSENDIINIHYQKVLQKELLVNLTSGTTGEPIKIYWDKNNSLRSHLALWRKREKYYGITPTDKYCCLHTTTYSGSRVGNLEKIIYDSNKSSLSFCKLFFDEETILDYYNKMCDFSPKWLFIQPSFLIRFINVLEKNNLKLPSTIHYIEFAGETAVKHDYEIVHSHLSCNIANMYGSMETNGIAYECPNHHLHILSDNVFVECLDDYGIETNCGRSIITSLNNFVFPLIRYNLGDIIKINKHIQCEYSDEPVIEEIIGRQKKAFISSENKILSEDIIDYCIRKAISEFGNFLYQYLVEFKNTNTINIVIYIRKKFEKWTNNISNVIKENFNELYVLINVNIVYNYNYFTSTIPLKRTIVNKLEV